MSGLDLSGKAESLADKMNKLTAKFDLAEELIVEGDDIIDFVEEKTHSAALLNSEIDLSVSDLSTANLVNLQLMLENFSYIRDTLRENTENGRRALNLITLELLDEESDKRAENVLLFTQLNTAICDNMRLYIASYKEISATLINLDKVKKSEKPDKVSVTNNLNVVNNETISTADLIKKLSGKEN